MFRFLTVALLGTCANAFTPLARLSAPTTSVAPRAAVYAMEPQPPSGFVWADSDSAAPAESSVKAPSTEVAEPAATPAPSDAKVETSAKAETAAKAEVATGDVVVQLDANGEKVPFNARWKGVVTPTGKPKWREGLFAPLVLGAKGVMGEQQLKELRASVIAKHSKVIANFVDTSDSEFGQLVLKRMFEYADKDGNGTLDKNEVRAALLDLGFDWLDEKQVEKVMNKADKDKNEVIDFEEFVNDTPRTLRVNLVKLAKKNGHDLGFLV